MKNRRLKVFTYSLLYIFVIAMLLGGVYVVEGFINNNLKDSVDVDSVNEIVEPDDDSSTEMPVISNQPVISRPYNNGSVKIVKNYYDYKGEENVQEDSLVYYGNTYMQNSGVDYGMESEFEVVSILDGIVMEVTDDEIMGKTVKIKHSNDLISVYQSLGSVDVKENDNVTQGMIIGKSGLSNVSRDLGNHLHFEIYYQGRVMNPENCYDKLPGDLK